MSFQEDSRVQAAIALLKEATSSTVSVDQLLALLREQTGGSVNALSSVSHEALKGIGLPNALAIAIAKKLRLKNSKAKSESFAQKHRRALLASEASDEELIKEFAKNPMNRSSRYFKALMQRVQDAPVVVWKNGNEIDVDATAKRVRDLTAGKKLNEVVTLGNGPTVPLAIGKHPDQEDQEHPLFPNEVLYGDGTGDDGYDWGSLDFKTRLFLAFLVSKNAFKISADEKLQIGQIYESARTGGIFKSYAKEVVEFEKITRNKRLHIFGRTRQHTDRRLANSLQ